MEGLLCRDQLGGGGGEGGGVVERGAPCCANILLPHRAASPQGGHLK